METSFKIAIVVLCSEFTIAHVHVYSNPIDTHPWHCYYYDHYYIATKYHIHIMGFVKYSPHSMLSPGTFVSMVIIVLELHFSLIVLWECGKGVIILKYLMEIISDRVTFYDDY